MGSDLHYWAREYGKDEVIRERNEELAQLRAKLAEYESGHGVNLVLRSVAEEMAAKAAADARAELTTDIERASAKVIEYEARAKRSAEHASEWQAVATDLRKQLAARGEAAAPSPGVKRAGRLFVFTRENDSVGVVNLDAVTYVSQHGPGVYARVDGGNLVDVPAEHGDAFLAALEARATEVG